MIITTTITSVVMTITMTFTMMTSVTKRRKRTRTTIITSQNHQVLLSQSQTQYHQVIMVTRPNQAMDHITVEFTPEVVSTLLLVTHNLMHQHQACQITGSDLLTLLIHGRHFHGKLEKVKLQHGQPIWVHLSVMEDSAGTATPLLMLTVMLITTVSMMAKVSSKCAQVKNISACGMREDTKAVSQKLAVDANLHTHAKTKWQKTLHGISPSQTTQESPVINVDQAQITILPDKNSKTRCAHGAVTVWSQTDSRQLIAISAITKISAATKNRQLTPPNSGLPMAILMPSHGTHVTTFTLVLTLMVNTTDYSWSLSKLLWARVSLEISPPDDNSGHFSKWRNSDYDVMMT